MSIVARVKLNTERCTEEHYVSFLAGRQSREVRLPGDSEYQWGISIFYDGNYVLNFVLSEDEVELLQSYMKVKAVNDLGFKFMASKHSLEILKYNSSLEKHNYLAERVGEIASGQGGYAMYSYNLISFISEKPNAFVEALRLTTNSPHTLSNLYTYIPEDVEVVEL